MKKKYMTAAAALITSMTLWLPEAAMAGQVGAILGTGYETSEAGQGTEQKDGGSNSNMPDVSGGDTVSGGERSLVSLQIPQRFEIVIDPWKLDGREQIYSEEYFIRNTGVTTGRLTLSFRCRVWEEDEITVRGDRQGIHEDGSKSIFMEVLFGDGTGLVLSQEVSEYQMELEPGEELALRFSGEVNENISEQWKNGDVTVECRYLWDAMEEAQSYKNRDEEKKISSHVGGTSVEKAEEGAAVSGNDLFIEGTLENVFSGHDGNLLVPGSGNTFPDRENIGDRAEKDSVSGNNQLFSNHI